jgi:hypothetical protein
MVSFHTPVAASLRCAHAALAGAPAARRPVRLGVGDALPIGRVAKGGLIALPGLRAVDAGAQV